MTTKDAPDVTKVLHTAHRAYCHDTGCFDGDDISQPEIEAAVIEAIDEARRPLVEALRAIKAHDLDGDGFEKCFEDIMTIADAALAAIPEENVIQ